MDFDLSKLCQALRRDRLVLQPFRENRRELVRRYVGRNYSSEGTREKVHCNLLALYVSIVGRSLVAKNPRVLLSTFKRQFRPVVAAMESWANREVERSKLDNTLRRAVTDALFSVGVVKVALATPADAAAASWALQAGKPFCEPVDLDDLVFDTRARDLANAAYVGHRLRVPLRAVRESKLYAKARKDLAPSTDNPFNLEGDERVKQIGQQYVAGADDEFEDMVDLWEVYLARHRLVVTLADDLTGTEPLRVQRWLGPDRGPFHFLGLGGTVPGNPMPKAPLQDLQDLDESTNRILRKLIRQAERQKEVLGVQGGAAEDGSRVMEANDGDIIRSDRPEAMKPMAFGGPNQANFALAESMRTLFSWLAGNLDMMGGLSPQSKTLGQDRMLEENASRGVADMQATTVDFASEVVGALCWYWHHDPRLEMEAAHPVPGMPNLAVRRKVTPAMRQTGTFEDLEVRIDPYSLQHQTPQSRLAALNQVVQQTIIPLTPQLQAQGVMFDVNAYLQKVAKYIDSPDLAEIVTVREPPPDTTATTEHNGPAMPGNTTRTSIRQNMPGRTQAGDTMNRVNALMGVDTGGASKGQGAA